MSEIGSLPISQVEWEKEKCKNAEVHGVVKHQRERTKGFSHTFSARLGNPQSADRSEGGDAAKRASFCVWTTCMSCALQTAPLHCARFFFHAVLRGMTDKAALHSEWKSNPATRMTTMAEKIQETHANERVREQIILRGWVPCRADRQCGEELPDSLRATSGGHHGDGTYAERRLF